MDTSRLVPAAIATLPVLGAAGEVALDMLGEPATTQVLVLAALALPWTLAVCVHFLRKRPAVRNIRIDLDRGASQPIADRGLSLDSARDEISLESRFRPFNCRF